jgi:pimeloyl-ACP methyl ester carboxylesterase
MQLDTTIRRGEPGKPVVIFIHGLGMDKGFWTSPAETMILARNVAMRYFAASKPLPSTSPPESKITIGDVPERINNLWHAVIERGFSTLCWSQRRPMGPISVAVEELAEIVSRVKSMFPQVPLLFVCHSRGGLIARKYMESDTDGIRALITIATPHHGSSLTKFAKHLSPVSSAIKRMLPEDARATAAIVLKNVLELISSTALKELLPGSDFIKGLAVTPEKGIEYLTFGGTETRMFDIYRWQKREGIFNPVTMLTIPGSLLKILPASVVPEEMKQGRGDFMVTAKSARLPWAAEHIDVPSNHISITWNSTVIQRTLELIEQI